MSILDDLDALSCFLGGKPHLAVLNQVRALDREHQRVELGLRCERVRWSTIASSNRQVLGSADAKWLTVFEHRLDQCVLYFARISGVRVGHQRGIDERRR